MGAKGQMAILRAMDDNRRPNQFVFGGLFGGSSRSEVLLFSVQLFLI
jgi:hypothetical protein